MPVICQGGFIESKWPTPARVTVPSLVVAEPEHCSNTSLGITLVKMHVSRSVPTERPAASRSLPVERSVSPGLGPAGGWSTKVRLATVSSTTVCTAG